MARIDWILEGAAMNHEISHKIGVINAVYKVAQKHASIARGHLLAHRAEGHSRIVVTRGDVDSFVSLNDERGDVAAAAIEYGNKYGGGGIDALGRAFGLT